MFDDRGPNVMKGHWDRSEATKASLVNGRRARRRCHRRRHPGLDQGSGGRAKHPRVVRIVDGLPETATEKIQKREIALDDV